MRPFLLLCFLALLAPIHANAKVSSIGIDELIESASVIVIARVTNLSKETVPAHPSRSGEVVFADAITQKTLKGTLPKQFRFLAQIDFICSETGAVKDELALFFLYRDKQGLLSIQAFGNGRMAISDVDGKSYVTATSVIRWAKDAPVKAGADQRDGSKFLDLAYVENLVANSIKSQAKAVADR